MTVLKPRIWEKKSPRDVLCPGGYAQRRMGGSGLATSVSKLLLYGSLLQDPQHPLRALLELGEIIFFKGPQVLGPTLDILISLSKAEAKTQNCG